MTHYRLEANIAVELDVEAAFAWYEAEETSLGVVFLEELSSTYQRILDNPLAFQEIRSGIRRALTRKFPYAIYFVIESQTILVIAVLHTQGILKNGKSELSFTLTSKLFHLIHVELAKAGCSDLRQESLSVWPSMLS